MSSPSACPLLRGNGCGYPKAGIFGFIKLQRRSIQDFAVFDDRFDISRVADLFVRPSSGTSPDSLPPMPGIP
jgi:hypothetical protein